MLNYGLFALLSTLSLPRPRLPMTTGNSELVIKSKSQKRRMPSRGRRTDYFSTKGGTHASSSMSPRRLLRFVSIMPSGTTPMNHSFYSLCSLTVVWILRSVFTVSLHKCLSSLSHQAEFNYVRRARLRPTFLSSTSGQHRLIGCLRTAAVCVKSIHVTSRRYSLHDFQCADLSHVSVFKEILSPGFILNF